MKKIMIIDCNDELLHRYSAEFRREGYEVVSETPPYLDRKRFKSEKFDLVIIDPRCSSFDEQQIYSIFGPNKHWPVLLNIGYAERPKSNWELKASSFVVKGSGASEIEELKRNAKILLSENYWAD